jgi:4-diphosphocytidyl-2-C-methyl-D-erythritol kinase
VSDPLQSKVVTRAPAKVNLGLEVLARRPDGYHDLATIFVTISLFDELSLIADERISVQCDHWHIAPEDNLVAQTLRTLAVETRTLFGARAELRKQIPTAAGLGGASSDAATTLVAARDLWRLGMTDDELAAIGGRIGSDVPFFVRGGCAVGRGRGELLEPLPVPTDVRFVVVAPTITIPRKTATLYGALQPEDCSDGSAVAAQAARLRSRRGIDPALLGNAFTRPLYSLVPALADLPDAFRDAGAPSVALSGAGPAHYAVVEDPQRAEHIAAKLRARLENSARVYVVEPVPARPRGHGHDDVQ